ncbi:hypothetical protein A1Q2_02984 [Trichosporon asahii var. asahii CBS 8904]|uniref:Uncharacterized protein n=2 Tax=Trichosporon asahii var. asahii TaxID=189963 RepID=K1WNY1_TRIAC|nr:hypothetical protein A1Q1_06957 [Trichosporon asahii var. asahii CBS 2479]EJT51819.1 hypothetical protein A1Q1_06957 [Trichosporon asahii var. asahii CBS 2479]EKD02754.1 hypothetical protein A1Q2_02984 [Trichosporon asahii var. asahii CBS 8904]
MLRYAARPLRAARGFSTSAPRRGGHSGAHGSAEHDTVENFMNATWRNAFIAIAAVALAVKYGPSPIEGVSASPSVSNDNLEKEAADKNAPWITRWYANNMKGDGKLWDERNAKHLELTMQAADTRLLYNEAELPHVYRLKNPSSFLQASPHSIGVGTQANLNGTVIKEDGSPDVTLKDVKI